MAVSRVTKRVIQPGAVRVRYLLRFPSRPLEDIVHGDDHGIRRHRHHRIEIAGRERIGKIAERVGEKRMRQRKIGAKRRLQQLGFSIDFSWLFAIS